MIFLIVALDYKNFWRSATQFDLDKNLYFYFSNIKQDCNLLYEGYM